MGHFPGQTAFCDGSPGPGGYRDAQVESLSIGQRAIHPPPITQRYLPSDATLVIAW